MRGYYLCRVKSRKFYKYIFYFLFDVSITNAFILYKNFCSSPTFNSIKKFRLQLAKELIVDYCSRSRVGRGGGVIRPLPLQHFPIKISKEPTDPERKRRRCARCSQKHHKRTQTQWFCRECQVFLCHTGETQTVFYYGIKTEYKMNSDYIMYFHLLSSIIAPVCLFKYTCTCTCRYTYIQTNYKIGDMKKNIPGSAILKMFRKRDCSCNVQ